MNCQTASWNWNNIKNLSALTQWPGIDKRATGGLNEKGTKPQTSVSLWNQRKHSGYKLIKLKMKRKKKKTFKRQRNTKHRDEALVFVNLYFLQKWQQNKYDFSKI